MRILFVCTANACRSQMAEAWARALFPAGWDVASAGLLTAAVSRRADAVMREVGLSLEGQHSKSIDAVDLDGFDLVVTLSEEAASYLPALEDPDRHWRRPFADPMAAEGDAEEQRAAFRRGRDRARAVVEEVLAAFSGGSPPGDVSPPPDDVPK